MRINEEKLSKSLSNTHKKGALMGGGGGEGQIELTLGASDMSLYNEYR